MFPIFSASAALDAKTQISLVLMYKSKQPDMEKKKCILRQNDKLNLVKEATANNVQDNTQATQAQSE